ncbi:MAG: MOSC domain-containing protein [Streptosporangiaceae bacterium]
MRDVTATNPSPGRQSGIAASAWPAGLVTSVSLDAGHAFSKPAMASITLLAGLGVAGDAHAGRTVQHRSRVARDPSAPNLRQVHLIHAELHDELTAGGFEVPPGGMGENITTRGLELLALSEGATLAIGPQAVLQVTGLRNPCTQLDGFRPGLMRAVLDRDAAGELVRKAGIMAVVLAGGVITPGDPILVRPPAGPHRPLRPV